MKISYNWLKSYIPDIPNEDEIEHLLTFKLCEIEDVEKLPSPSSDKASGDTVFNLKILPDRAHDLLSHLGVAREISGMLGIDFKLPEYKIPEFKVTDLKIEIQTSNCRRYVGRVVRDIKVGPSPEWMVKYLNSIGQKSINNIVDATNMVMFGSGQPIHAFDLKQLAYERIIVKEAQGGDLFQLIGSEKTSVLLKDTDMMITDGSKNLALAGVKGGLDSGISLDTTNILLEVANFDPVSVRKTARGLGIQTDASKRYENDLSPSLCGFAMDEISALIMELCPGASFEEIIDVYSNPQKERIVSFETSYVAKILGLSIKEEEIEKILKNYNYKFEKKNSSWKVTVPLMRLDLVGDYNFVEEIGRVYGYDKITPLIPELISEGEDNGIWKKTISAKQKLIQDGYREVMTYVFRNNGDFEILAAASDKNFLRTNLTDGLKESISLNQKNLPLLGSDEVRVFEIGTVFKDDGEEIHVAYGDKKNITEMTLNKFSSIPENINILLSEYVLEEPLTQKENTDKFVPQIFKPWSIYPFITRDIAVWVPEGTSPQTLIDIYNSFGTELLVTEPKIFDSFTKENRTSLAFRLVFQSYDRTLTDDEINVIMSQINTKIASLGWEVR
ncbi:MAG: phenylalanine--tRNA ligase subunit beta [Candidatus Pacebacteria bacterium]|nr:phenylalanine--tRNA ligase subunit beta [Candidatus Paceibacterota bacterium]